MSATYVWSPDLGWRILKGPAFTLPGKRYITERDVRQQLGTALTQGLSIGRLARFPPLRRRHAHRAEGRRR